MKLSQAEKGYRNTEMVVLRVEPMRPHIFLAMSVLSIYVVPASHAQEEMDVPAKFYGELRTVFPHLPAHEGRTSIVLVSTAPEAALVALKATVGEFPVRSVIHVRAGFIATLTPAQMAALANHPLVDQVEIDELGAYYALGPARDFFGVDKAVFDFSVNGDRDGNRKSFSATDVTACVLDSGIHNQHVDLDEGQVRLWRDFISGGSSPYDDNGHGTNVAGILAGQGDGAWSNRGVAYGAALVVGKVGTASGPSSAAVLEGINWCWEKRTQYAIKIINISLGGTTCSNGGHSTEQALNGAFESGMLPVVAAGNSGPALCTVSWPAGADKALTVCNMADPSERGFFVHRTSSRGGGTSYRKPEVCGPGVNMEGPLKGTNSAYSPMSGTSQATPFVAGVAALMLDGNYGLTPYDLKWWVTTTLQDWFGAADWDGGGRLQAYDAIRGAVGGSGAGPSVPNYHGFVEPISQGGVDVFSLTSTSTYWPLGVTLAENAVGGPQDVSLTVYRISGGGRVTEGISNTGTRSEVVAITATTATYEVEIRDVIGNGLNNYRLEFSFGGARPTLTQNG